MSHPTQSYVRNCLLSALSGEDYALLAPHLEQVPLEKGQLLIEKNVPFEYVYFPERGVGSVMSSSPNTQRVETSLFGRDGMSGISLVLGTAQTPQTSIIQVEGDGYRIPTGALAEAMARSASLHRILLLYVQTTVAQTSSTALSNVVQSIEERLARWLLMVHDRADGDELPLTHEFLSIMLGVRRPSVTTALHVLEGDHLISARRGLVTVLDRDGLIDLADGVYGEPEDEYHRLLGPSS
jgi:CRP-like cAMP-binding protein